MEYNFLLNSVLGSLAFMPKTVDAKVSVCAREGLKDLCYPKLLQLVSLLILAKYQKLPKYLLYLNILDCSHLI